MRGGTLRSSAAALLLALAAPAAAAAPTGATTVRARANPDDATVLVAWGAAPGATTYEVERALEEAGRVGAFRPLAGALAGHEWVDRDVQPNTRLWYRVRGVGPEGPGPFSSAASVVAVSRFVPPAPARERIPNRRFRGMQMRGHGPLSPEGDVRLTDPGALEGRPPPEELSPLQARVDAALDGETLTVEAGDYRGDLYLDRPLRLVGRGRPRLIGSGRGSVVLVRADGVTVEGFEIDGRAGGDLASGASGVHVKGAAAVVRGCTIANARFGVFLREATGAVVEDNVIRGPALPVEEKASGVHVWRSHGVRVLRNRISGTRDGVYLQESSKGLVAGNQVREARYGVHAMACDEDAIEDNLLERSVAGVVLMYSNHLQLRRNRVLHHRETTSVGMLFKDLHESLVEDNLVADNVRGLLVETSWKTVLRRNLVAESDVAVQVWGGCLRTRFEGNSFVGNLTPVAVFTQFGAAPEAFFEGNYWSDNDEPDLDGDGRSDRPHVLGSPFDLFRRRVGSADLLAQSPAAMALGTATRAFPAIDGRQATDARPLARPPALAALPRVEGAQERVGVPGLVASLGLLGVGLFALRSGRGGRA